MRERCREGRRGKSSWACRELILGFVAFENALNPCSFFWCDPTWKNAVGKSDELERQVKKSVRTRVKGGVKKKKK